MSAGRTTEKPPRIKGLVKRCRSFKEDILSRLARNRSLGKEESPGTSRRMHNCSSEGTSPTPGATDTSPTAPSHPPQVSLSHRLKEAYLTLQFVESLIRKNCIDLLGGSSNVMLDLMGSLLSEVRKTAVSDSPAYQSVISQIKLVLSEFLVAVDVLLLNDGCEDHHKELSCQKLLDTLKSIREALDRLKGLLNSKENGHSQDGSSSSSSLLLLSSSPNVNLTLKSPSSTSRLDSMTFDSMNLLTTTPAEIRKPPLPPKLKQWVGKSFDMAMEMQPPLPSQLMNQKGQCSSNHLSDWLERSQCQSGNGGSSSTQHYSSQPQFLNVHSGQLVKKPEEGSGEKWTDSAVYLCRSSKSSSGAQQQFLDDLSLHNERIRKLRTMSDSFYGGSGGVGDSEESLDQILAPEPEDEDMGSQTTTSHSHCSQSLSLGSSLDNLLLVDSVSQHSGLSPNSRDRVSSSSMNNQSTSPHSPGRTERGLAGLSTYDPEQDPDLDADVFTTEDRPPELPKKTRQFVIGTNDGVANGNPRCPSPYDNVDDLQSELVAWHSEAQSRISTSQQQRQFMTYSESRATLVGLGSGNGTEISEDRPPLPPKKKHSITAYVEFLHNFDASAHHQHFQNHQSITNQGNHPAPAYQNTFISRNRHHPPGAHSSVTLYNPQLPGIPGGSSVNSRASYSHSTSTSYHHFSSFSSTATYTAPTTTSEEDLLGSREVVSSTNQYQPIPNPNSSFDSSGGPTSESGTTSNSSLNHNNLSQQQPPALPPKKCMKHSVSEHEDTTSCGPSWPVASLSPSKVISSPTHSLPPLGIESTEGAKGIDEDNPDLYLLDVFGRLVQNDTSQSTGKVGSDGPEIKGGDPHILMVYAASPDLTDLKFREVFLLTYRTFVRPLDLVSLLWKRFEYFENKADRISMIHRRATLELFVDVICSLTPMDMEDEMILKVRDCVYHLVNSGEIHSALKSRKGLLDKYDVRIKLLGPKPVPATLAVTTEAQSLLRWNATSIAQQMTLLDSDLFRQLEPAELLLWAREQQEDFCPALNNFTDHFNKVSYWARSKVLLCPNSRERNRTMKKMIEVMRKLREYSNFNSLLAVLAALDSAPIRRLGFSRRLTEALKPHAALTDSSGSFRTYRQALAESKPPCIPYIGLVLQDLTFVHIGNADFLISDGKVNWLKRWQQWLVLEPIRRFHACHYGFMRNDALLSFLNNFDESLNDDDLWQVSESIKPRGKS